jgi:predicted nucleotidyltransferase
VNKLFKVNPLYKEYVNLICRSIRSRLKDSLISIVLFGSVARGEEGEGSDIDLLVISSGFKGSVGERLKTFQEIELSLVKSDARVKLRRSKLGTSISPIPLTPEEVKKNPPILLDILTDGVILYDKDDFIRRHLSKFKRRLKALGARKIFLPSGKWYWDLKPDYKFGEVIEI